MKKLIRENELHFELWTDGEDDVVIKHHKENGLLTSSWTRDISFIPSSLLEAKEVLSFCQWEAVVTLPKDFKPINDQFLIYSTRYGEVVQKHILFERAI